MYTAQTFCEKICIIVCFVLLYVKSIYINFKKIFINIKKFISSILYVI